MIRAAGWETLLVLFIYLSCVQGAKGGGVEGGGGITHNSDFFKLSRITEK